MVLAHSTCAGRHQGAWSRAGLQCLLRLPCGFLLRPTGCGVHVSIPAAAARGTLPVWGAPPRGAGGTDAACCVLALRGHDVFNALDIFQNSEVCPCTQPCRWLGLSCHACGVRHDPIEGLLDRALTRAI